MLQIGIALCVCIAWNHIAQLCEAEPYSGTQVTKYVGSSAMICI